MTDIEERVAFCHRNPWAGPKRPILNKVKDIVSFFFSKCVFLKACDALISDSATNILIYETFLVATDIE